MKKGAATYFLILCFTFLISYSTTQAQCSICAKTAQQMGEGPAKGMNSGIIYLMLTPFVLIGYIGYRWWKSNGRAQQ